MSSILIISCKKDTSSIDTTPPPPPPPSTTMLATDMTQVSPGDLIIIKVSRKVPANEIDILFNTISIKGYANGDSSYFLYAPVAPVGDNLISIPSIQNSNKVNITVNNYVAISDPQLIINDYFDKTNKCLDSLTKVIPGVNIQPSSGTLLLFNQLKEELNYQISKLSSKDKELFSYVLRKNTLDPTIFSRNYLPPQYYAKINFDAAKIGEELLNDAKSYSLTIVGTVATIPVVLISGAIALKVPNPYTIGLFATSLGTYLYLAHLARERAAKVGKMKAVGDYIQSSSTQRTSNEFFNNSEKSVLMTVNFRNLKSSDAGLHGDIVNAMTKESDYESEDRKIADVYNKIISIMEKLKGTYQIYSSTIGKQPQGTIGIPIDGKDIIIKGVSDSRISFAPLLSGITRIVKISSTANTDINFNLQVAYKRTIDGQEFTKDIPCIFKGKTDTLALLRSKSWILSNGNIESVDGFTCGGVTYRSVLQNAVLSFSSGAQGILLYNSALSGIVRVFTGITPCSSESIRTISYSGVVEGKLPGLFFNAGTSTTSMRPLWNSNIVSLDETRLVLNSQSYSGNLIFNAQ